MKIYEQLVKDLNEMTVEKFRDKYFEDEFFRRNIYLTDFYNYMHKEVPKEYNLTFMETLNYPVGTLFKCETNKELYVWDNVWLKSVRTKTPCNLAKAFIVGKYRVADDV